MPYWGNDWGSLGIIIFLPGDDWVLSRRRYESHQYMTNYNMNDSNPHMHAVIVSFFRSSHHTLSVQHCTYLHVCVGCGDDVVRDYCPGSVNKSLLISSSFTLNVCGSVQRVILSTNMIVLMCCTHIRSSGQNTAIET